MKKENMLVIYQMIQIKCEYYSLRKVNFKAIEYFQIKLFCKILLILENVTDKMSGRSKIWPDNWHFRPLYRPLHDLLQFHEINLKICKKQT